MQCDGRARETIQVENGQEEKTQYIMYSKCKTVHLEMAKGEQEEVNQANVVSYFKSLTLEKKYGTTGAIEMEQGAVYIGKKILIVDFISVEEYIDLLSIGNSLELLPHINR